MLRPQNLKTVKLFKYVSAVTEWFICVSLPDKGGGQEPHQADSSAAHCSDPAAQDVGEDADDGRAKEDHPHGKGAHQRCSRHREKAREEDEWVQQQEAEYSCVQHKQSVEMLLLYPQML